MRLLLLAVFFSVLATARAMPTATSVASVEKEHASSFFWNLMGFPSLLGSRTVTTTPQKEFLVLGAGLGRTGTHSQKRALERLGYKVLHSLDLASSGLVDSYARALRSPEAFDAFCDEALALGFNATLDSSFALLLPQFMKRYPRAKILYATRDPETWARSFDTLRGRLGGPVFSAPFKFFANLSWARDAHTLYGHGLDFHPRPCTRPPLSWYAAVAPEGWYVCDFEATIPLADFYRRHDAAVRRWIEEYGRLQDTLVFDVKQGWRPLLDFFRISQNHPLRLAPFPKENDFDNIELVAGFMHSVVYLFPWALVAMGVGMGRKLWRGRPGLVM